MNKAKKAGKFFLVFTDFKDKPIVTAYLIRCPSCGKENWAMFVASGICTWCGYDTNVSFAFTRRGAVPNDR